MKASKIAHKYPTYRDDNLKSSMRWLDGKKLDDNAEGFWRIHDKLYDFTNFIKHHPGGSDWLVLTQGVDITEQFESHHITGAAEKVLPKYFIRNASHPRNYKITFDESGFYRTLKRRVANKMEFLDHSESGISSFYCDFMFTSLMLLAVVSARDDNLFMGFLASIALLWLSEISHNFIHKKDNWRMYLMNLSGVSFREWRIFHAMSHHLYPNSYHDLEISFFEPFLNWLPGEKSTLLKYAQWIISPLIYALIFIGQFAMRLAGAIIYKHSLHWDDLLPFALPTTMLLFGNSSPWIVMKLWSFIIVCASLMHGFVALNAGHHHETVFHDGDDLKSTDFGVYQLSATIDRIDIGKSLFLTLTNFGNHVLHHMFPTLDHAILPQLHETLINTCVEFECELREFPWWTLIAGQFKQLTRTEPNRLEL